MKRRAVFLDRDGTIDMQVGYWYGSLKPYQSEAESSDKIGGSEANWFYSEASQTAVYVPL